MGNEKISFDYEARCKELEKIIAQQREEINNEWQKNLKAKQKKLAKLQKNQKMKINFIKILLKVYYIYEGVIKYVYKIK